MTNDKRIEITDWPDLIPLPPIDQKLVRSVDCDTGVRSSEIGQVAVLCP